MERREGRGVAADTLLLVGFPDVAAAERRLAGVAAAARWTATARAAGGRDLAVVIDGPTRAWSTETLDDFRRAGAPPPPQVAAATLDAFLGARPPGPALRVAGRFLPAADALAALLAASPPAGASAPAAVVAPAADLDRPAAAVRRLVRATAKPSDGLVSRSLNRPISQRVSAWLLLHAPAVRPSHATAAVAVVATAMVAAFFFGGWPGLIAGGVLFHVASVLDGVDGEIARASFRSSVAGAVLDTRVDVATNLGYFVGIAVSLTRLYGAREATVGAAVVLMGVVGMLLLARLARHAGRPGNLDVLKSYYRRRFPTGWRRRVVDTLVAMTSRDFFAFGFGVIIVLGGGWTVSWLLAGFGATWLVAIVAAIPGLMRGDDAAIGTEALAGAE